MAVIKSEYLLPNYDPEEVGMKGEKGEDGRTSYVHIAYSNSSDGGVDFSTTDPTNRAYTGYYTDFEMIDSTDPSKYEWQRTKGDSGDDGIAGKDGVGLQSTNITYAKHTNASIPPSTGWQEQVPTVPAGQYLWTKTVWNYTDSTSETGYSVARMGQDGAKGNDGIAGKDGVGIKTTTVTYTASTNGTTAPATGWSPNIPTVPAGQYLWTKTVWTYTDSSSETGYSVARMGSNGLNGANGADGVGIATTIVEYNKSTNSTTPPSSGWTSTIPSISGGQYLWTRTTLNYTNGQKAESYTVARQGEDGADGQLFTGETEPTDFNEGDIWYKVVSGKVTGVYEAKGGAWVEIPFESSVIAETIIGKTIQASHLTGSTIDGGKISGAEFLNEYTNVTSGVNQVTDGKLGIKDGILQAGSTFYLTNSAGERLYKFATTEADIHQGTVNLRQRLYDETGTQTSESTTAVSGGLITLSLTDASGSYNGILDAKGLTKTPWINLQMGSLWEAAENNPPQYRIIYNLDGSRTIKFKGQVKLKSGTMSPGNTYLPFSQSNSGGPHYLPESIRPQSTAFAYAPVGVSSGTTYGGQWAVTPSGWFSLGVAQSNTTYAVLTSLSYDLV
ncbi:virion structural protein [Enterococcus phage BUCT630]